MSEISLATACTAQAPSYGEKKTWTILQKRGLTELTGYSCRVTKSEFSLFCGAYSHQKYLKSPDIEIPVPISQHECQTAAKNNKYITSYGTVHETAFGAETIFTATEMGVITEGNGNVYCEGEDLKYNNNIINGVLVLTQYRVRIMAEDFVVDNHRVETTSSHLRLPKECAPESGHCTAEGTTYLWEYHRPCPLVKIRAIQLQNEGDYLVDHVNKLLFKEMDKSRFPPECGGNHGLYYYTEYDDLYLTEEKGEFELVTEINVGTYLQSRDEYLSYQFEKKSQSLTHSIQQQLCSTNYQQSTDNTNSIVRVQGDHFGRRMGDIMYVFKCKSKSAEVANLKQCYNRIPIHAENGDLLFVDPVTKVSTQHASVIPCPPESFATAILTREEKWISINPDIKIRPKPSDNTLIKFDEEVHENMAVTGLYTPQEVLDWTREIEWDRFKDTVVEQISSGVCKAESECGYSNIEGQEAYHLSSLAKSFESVTTSPIDLLRKFIEKNLVYVSIFIITKWILDVAITITLIGITLTQEGIKGALTFMYRTFLPSVYRHRKNEERRQRKQYNVVSTQQEMTETSLTNNAIDKLYPGVPGVPNYSRPTGLMLGASAPSNANTTQQN